MNFLQLVNRLKRKSAVPGAQLTSLSNQVEEINKLIDSINEAWVDIQLMREDWLWMRGTASCVTTAGKATYAPAADFLLTDHANWAPRTFRNYVTAVGPTSEIRTDPIDYDQWRNTYQFGANRSVQTRPIEITVTPNLSIGVGPFPAAGYTITGDYYRVPSELVALTDTPGLPSQYHMMIVYRAMMFFGASEAATEVYSEGKDEFARLSRALVLNQIDGFEIGGALA